MGADPQNGLITIERSWKRTDRIELAFDFETRAVSGFNQTVTVERGPLLFSLPIEARWEKLRDNGFSEGHGLEKDTRDNGLSADWEVFPTSAWNYGIAPGASFTVTEQMISSIPFSSHAPPATVTVNAQRVPQWMTHLSYAPAPPEDPVALSNESFQTLTLIPYGAAKLRITAFPTVLKG